MKRRSLLKTGSSLLSLPLLLNANDLHASSKAPKDVSTPEGRAMYLQRTLKKICGDLGPRPIGSPDYEKSAEIVKDELARSLPTAYLDTFPFERWKLNGDAELLIGDQWYEAYPSHGSSGTPPVGITGILVENKENGLAYSVINPMTEKPIGYIAVFPTGTARPRPYYSFGQDVKCLPIFTVGNQDRPAFENALARKTLVTMKADVKFIPDTKTSNVVGTLPGSSKEEIVLIAHLDTVYNTQGANDNTATVIVMMMLAHALAGTVPDKTITFLATTGEEYNKLGAINYVERRKREGTLDDIAYVFNVDSWTWGPNLVIYSDDVELWNTVTEIDRKVNPKGVPTLQPDGFWLDARPFRETGARALSFSSGGLDVSTFCWHRPDDIPANVSVELSEVGYQILSSFIGQVMGL